MKPAKRKTPAQLEKEAESKTDAWNRAAQKEGEGVRHTFVRLAKEAHGCEFEEAERLFEAAEKAGTIIEVRRGGLLKDRPIYAAKKIN